MFVLPIRDCVPGSPLVLRESVPARTNVHAIEDFPMLETYTQVCAFCGLVGHYRHFIKGLTHTARPLYDVLGKEVKMGPVQLPPEAREAVRILKNKKQMAPCWCFQTLTNHPSWRWTLPRKGWEWCFPKSKMMGAIIHSHLEVIP